jgi:bacterioferritin
MTAQAQTKGDKPFLTDVKTLRERARKHLESGAIGTNYIGDVKKTIQILQEVLATEIVCTLRYSQNAIAAHGISSQAAKAEFAQHAKEEWEHALTVAERIAQLGGEPDFNPQGLATKSAAQYAIGDNLVEMIKENLIAERIAIDDDDPGTRVMIEGILTVEEEHADDMHDLLVAHEGKPQLSK